jgi:hypothetical protein
MSYSDQIKIITAAMDGKTIAGRRKNSHEWVTHCDKVKVREIFYGERDVQFNFQDFEYKIVS